MSLIGFHRVLIGTAIAFCFGFAAWELLTWWVARQPGALVLGGVFFALGGLLSFYLSKLRHFVGYQDQEGERSLPREIGDAR
ncbi:MAG: hypothetical protein KY453_04125 [Gemmatimonadetes bacterium]|nr:hypothetical protein [Gemmatimonadota bacterium]